MLTLHRSTRFVLFCKKAFNSTPTFRSTSIKIFTSICERAPSWNCFYRQKFIFTWFSSICSWTSKICEVDIFCVPPMFDTMLAPPRSARVVFCQVREINLKKNTLQTHRSLQGQSWHVPYTLVTPSSKNGAYLKGVCARALWHVNVSFSSGGRLRRRKKLLGFRPRSMCSTPRGLITRASSWSACPFAGRPSIIGQSSALFFQFSRCKAGN